MDAPEDGDGRESADAIIHQYSVVRESGAKRSKFTKSLKRSSSRIDTGARLRPLHLLLT